MRRAPKGDPGKERLLFSIWCEISGKAQREKWTGRGERKEVVGNREGGISGQTDTLETY